MRNAGWMRLGLDQSILDVNVHSTLWTRFGKYIHYIFRKLCASPLPVQQVQPLLPRPSSAAIPQQILVGRKPGFFWVMQSLLYSCLDLWLAVLGASNPPTPMMHIAHFRPISTKFINFLPISAKFIYFPPFCVQFTFVGIYNLCVSSAPIWCMMHLSCFTCAGCPWVVCGCKVQGGIAVFLLCYGSECLTVWTQDENGILTAETIWLQGKIFSGISWDSATT